MSAAREAIAQLAFTAEPPKFNAVFKLVADDFCVTEDLGFALSGDGEHHCFQIRKTDVTTTQVVKHLAQLAGVREHDVGYAGLKDRMGVCVQWLSVYQPHRQNIDISALEATGVEVLQRMRNSRKIRRGSHKHNEFVIRLRGVDATAHSELEERLQRVAQKGVPNYFGEQRFGHSNRNVDMALRLFSGQLRLRRGFKKGMLLSAARSYVFNELLSQRVRSKNWDTYLAGDVMSLAGTESVFVPEQWDATLADRLRSGDIHPTGALWGSGPLRSSADTRVLEEQVAQCHQDLCEGLEAAGMMQARRSLRLTVGAMSWQFLQNEDLEVRFTLPPGAYATSVLREVCELKEAIDE
jgi:tRNA pseudouridine13 synthase